MGIKLLTGQQAGDNMKKCLSIILILAMLFSFAACGQGQSVEQSEEKKQTNIDEMEFSDKITLMYYGKVYKPGEIIETDDIDSITVLINGTTTVSAAPFEVTTDKENVLEIDKGNGTSIKFNPNKKGTTVVTISTATASENFIITTDTGKEDASTIETAKTNSTKDQSQQPNQNISSLASHIDNVAQFGNELTYTEVKESVNLKMSKLLNSSPDLSQVAQYQKHKKGEVNITKEEIDSLSPKRSLESNVSYDDAVYDIDLFFRAMKYSYGPYYLFGEDKFDNAKNAILDKLQGKASISGKDLETLLYENTKFIADGHFWIGKHQGLNSSNSYLYYYSDTSFFKDNEGYYTVIDGEKWYYSSCNNSYVSMKETLRKEGYLEYSLLQFCPSAYAHKNDDVVLIQNGTEKSMNVTWTLSKNYANSYYVNDPDYKFIQSNGISYVSIRGYNSELYAQKLKDIAVDAKNWLIGTDVLIIDARSSGGGTQSRMLDILESAFGSRPSVNYFCTNWSTYPRTGSDNPFGCDWGKEVYSNPLVTKGHVIKTIFQSLFFVIRIMDRVVTL